MDEARSRAAADGAAAATDEDDASPRAGAMVIEQLVAPRHPRSARAGGDGRRSRATASSTGAGARWPTTTGRCRSATARPSRSRTWWRARPSWRRRSPTIARWRSAPAAATRRRCWRELAARGLRHRDRPGAGARGRAQCWPRLGYDNVTVESFDGSGGWPEHAPYDVIIVSAGAPRIPPLLVAELADGGRLVIPVGGPEEQELAVVRREGDHYATSYDTRCRYVDLLGRFGVGGGAPAA